MKVRVHCWVSGKVQGVSFRSYTKQIAVELELTGWVKNLPNGDVEVIVEGGDEEVKKFVRLIDRGPPNARVDNLKIKKECYSGVLGGFKIVHY